MKGYQKLYPDKDPETVEEHATQLFKAADTDGSGEIDFGEWCTASINQNALLNETNMRAAFDLFDKDRGGTIEASEIAAILGASSTSEDQVWLDVIREVDINGDGKIDFEEFKVMMTKMADHEAQQQQAPAVAA